MAEIATIGRPYAEALFKAAGAGDVAALASEVEAYAAVASDPDLRVLADNPKTSDERLYDVISSVATGGKPASKAAQNFLRIVIDNGRLAALPEIAAQFHALVNARSGVSDAVVYSAFAIDPAQLGDVVAALEKRFGRKLNVTVVVEPELIGGIRAVVGDEVYDASVQASLQHMKSVLSA
jgi:F-type H+-transporting ATPase subunit delta